MNCEHLEQKELKLSPLLRQMTNYEVLEKVFVCLKCGLLMDERLDAEPAKRQRFSWLREKFGFMGDEC